MTTPPRDQDEPAEQAALRWLIELQDAPEDEALRDRFADWLAASPRHAASWQEASKLAGLLDEARLASPSRRGGEIRELPHRPWRKAGLALAAMAAAACLAVVLLPELLLRLEADYRTAVGETRAVRLADGSAIHLAADSAVTVERGADRRRVTLLAGAAYFEVAADPARPFTVAADALDATAIGTAFEVRLTRAGAAVAVSEGTVSVAVAQEPQPERLRSGDWLQVSGLQPAVARGRAPPGQVAAWRRGQLIVKDWSLDEVVEALGRYVDGTIVIADGALAQRQVTGVYDLGDPLAALRSAVYPHRGVVRRFTPWLVVVSGR